MQSLRKNLIHKLKTQRRGAFSLMVEGNRLDNAGTFTTAAVSTVGPRAASVSISVRVITPQKLGLTNALVTLTDMQGNSRTVITGKGSSFRFTNVMAGETYILTVSSKRYTYAPQIITVTEDITELSFNAQ
jgi:hypothetical protein